MQLTIDNITKRYRSNYALREVSTQLQRGVYGLLGANGAGKTTLINILIGVLAPNGGKILFDGVDIKMLGTSYLGRIGYMPQYPRFYPNFRVDEFLEYMCRIKAIPARESARIIDRVLGQVNLETHRRKRICELSGGMRQRVGIAQAILNDPKILILDEPTAGLDPAERIRFRNIISKIAAERIVLIATHIVSDIEYIANEVLILKDGVLVQQGTIQELCKREEGRVWKISLPDKELPQVMDQYLIGNIRREGERVQVRLICDTKPSIPSEAVKPQLEDVFLDIFGEDGGTS